MSFASDIRTVWPARLRSRPAPETLHSIGLRVGQAIRRSLPVVLAFACMLGVTTAIVALKVAMWWPRLVQ